MGGIAVVGFSMVVGGRDEEDVPLIIFVACFVSDLFSLKRKR